MTNRYSSYTRPSSNAIKILARFKFIRCSLEIFTEKKANIQEILAIITPIKAMILELLESEKT